MKSCYCRSNCLIVLLLAALRLEPVASAQTNGVLREFYAGIGGGLQGFTNSPSFPDSPTSEFIGMAFFEAPSNIGDNYGQRMRALLSPPTSGTYVFYIASDDQSVLFLSNDANPAHKIQICSEPAWNGERQFVNGGNQGSRGNKS